MWVKANEITVMKDMHVESSIKVKANVYIMIRIMSVYKFWGMGQEQLKKYIVNY